MSFAKDVSLSAIIAGFVSVMVGFTSAGVIVFQAAQALGASPVEIGSWILALGVGMGLTSILLSWRYKMPVVTAWSTPGAALLIPAAAGVSMAEGIGAFLVCAVLIAAVGFTGWFERVMNAIPLALASAMLAGILLRFGLNVFVAMESQFVMTFAMFCVYLLMRRVAPRFTILAALVVGVLIAGVQGLLQLDAVQWQLAQPVVTVPQFSVRAIVGIALPLFVVTMASQNVPGVATMRAFGYSTPISSVIGWTGVATLVLAPFGAFAINLAAITAAIAMGTEANEDPDKRYVAAMAGGFFYIVVGVFGATMVGLFSALPEELVFAIAGLALLGTIGKSLAISLTNEKDREAALVTFLVTASGMTLVSVGSAFWGIVAGALVSASYRFAEAGSNADD
ncbi:MAG: benzoate/H(+) symporter BenE family transporter [Cyanobacteria bacterium P01_C01_bin.69]